MTKSIQPFCAIARAISPLSCDCKAHSVYAWKILGSLNDVFCHHARGTNSLHKWQQFDGWYNWQIAMWQRNISVIWSHISKRRFPIFKGFKVTYCWHESLKTYTLRSESLLAYRWSLIRHPATVPLGLHLFRAHHVFNVESNWSSNASLSVATLQIPFP